MSEATAWPGDSRSIDTAPKGEYVLLWWKHCRAWSIGRWESAGGRKGWRCVEDAEMPQNQIDCTHWLPLPPRPI